MWRAALLVGLTATVGGAGWNWAAESGAPDSLPTIAGVFGPTPVGEHSYIAAYVPLAKNRALAGLIWYTNDGTLVFPQLLLAGGTADQPVAATSATQIQTGLQGQSEQWSEVLFSEPVVSSGVGFYALFRLPAGSECVSAGSGGGAGLGYGTGSGGAPGWLSADGQNWAKLSPEYQLAVHPVFVTAGPGMRVISSGEKSLAGHQKEPAPAYTTALLPAAPNPFNPHTQIRYSLAQAGRVKLAVYDLRGRLVRRLLDEEVAAGSHTLDWSGRDDRGRNLASGIYFLRFVAGGLTGMQRVTLVR